MVEAGRGTLSLSALARESRFSKATVCAALKGLRRWGYIEMQMDDQDHRRKQIVLTERARAAETDIKQYISAFHRALCAGIPEEDLRDFEKTLRMILQNVKNVRARSP